jgi:ATP-binding cassette subfamily E protein 1
MRVNPENKTGKECIVIDADKKIKINEDQCGIGVQISANKCPFNAIDIVKLPEALEKDPVHSFGENAFRLFDLPIPKQEHVVGIIGRNGIGKSTAVKILSSMIQPNLGKDEGATIDDLIQYYKGKEAQTFFEKVKENKLSVIYKPQQVDAIPKLVKGTVKDVLTKADEREMMDEAIASLDLKHILDTQIDKISGGELQRVAIAVAALKKADVYVFDEPTSYLDIKQRLKVVTFIKSLAQQTSVIVIEHDLIILDAVSDQMHIMFGKAGAYGIVSLPKATKAGINTFLDGYIREENMRFRDHPIKFLAKNITKRPNTHVVASWEGLKKQAGKFHLSAPQGELKKGEVVGVLGENGIGKTTFVRLIAGVDKPDEGNIETAPVSYKPQFLETDDDRTVAEIVNLAKHGTKLRHLNLHELAWKKLKQLSGGELQRVAIAQCLSQDAEVYVLDEPSAYLDVEQRMMVAKMIKDIAETNECAVLVVDHDLLFLDYLSDRLCVFVGEPAIHGDCTGPYPMEEGMNHFLKELNITFRRDPQNNRPRLNKLDSQMDREQKSSGRLYY